MSIPTTDKKYGALGIFTQPLVPPTFSEGGWWVDDAQIAFFWFRYLRKFEKINPFQEKCFCKIHVCPAIN